MYVSQTFRNSTRRCLRSLGSPGGVTLFEVAVSSRHWLSGVLGNFRGKTFGSSHQFYDMSSYILVIHKQVLLSTQGFLMFLFLLVQAISRCLLWQNGLGCRKTQWINVVSFPLLWVVFLRHCRHRMRRFNAILRVGLYICGSITKGDLTEIRFRDCCYVSSLTLLQDANYAVEPQVFVHGGD